jgi:hypothetical protein
MYPSVQSRRSRALDQIRENMAWMLDGHILCLDSRETNQRRIQTVTLGYTRTYTYIPINSTTMVICRVS